MNTQICVLFELFLSMWYWSIVVVELIKDWVLNYDYDY